jgi:alpha-1,2-mannosyltransferase
MIVDNLIKLAEDLKISDSIEFKIGAKRDEIFEIFSKAKVAIHTMKYEHFGIAIVELMASGIITIAHNSGKTFFLISNIVYSWSKTRYYWR